MANNYLQFSEVIPHLTIEEERWLAAQLEIIHVYDGKEYLATDLPEALAAARPEWCGCRAYRDLDGFDPEMAEGAGFDYEFDTDSSSYDNWGRHLWVYAEEYGDLELLAHLVQQFLKRFRTQDSWTLGYACTCSKPRVGEFGGGAVYVDAEQILFFDGRNSAQARQQLFEYGKRASNAATGETRPIEMYVGLPDRWYLATIAIPADTPPSAEAAIASALLEKRFAAHAEKPLFYGIFRGAAAEKPSPTNSAENL
jgi:hypothetical protein